MIKKPAVVKGWGGGGGGDTRARPGREGWVGELGGGQIKQCSLPCEFFMLVFELYILAHK